MAPTTPLLDLITTTPRDTIRIDGVIYELRRHEDLTLYDGRMLTKWGAQLDEIERLDDPTPQQGEQYAELLRNIVRLAVPDAGDTVIAALSPTAARQVLTVFIGLSGPRRGAGSVAAPAAPSSAGKTPSLGSSASTAARRARGSARRRSASSTPTSR